MLVSWKSVQGWKGVITKKSLVPLGFFFKFLPVFSLKDCNVMIPISEMVQEKHGRCVVDYFLHVNGYYAWHHL
jgi:hypothetical protein